MKQYEIYKWQVLTNFSFSFSYAWWNCHLVTKALVFHAAYNSINHVYISHCFSDLLQQPWVSISISLKWVSLALGNKHAACFSRFASRLNVLPFRRVLLTALVPLLLHLIMDMPAHIIAFCRWLPLCLARPASLRSLSEPCVVVLAPSLSPRIGKCLIPKHAAENRSSASRM